MRLRCSQRRSGRHLASLCASSAANMVVAEANQFCFVVLAYGKAHFVAEKPLSAHHVVAPESSNTQQAPTNGAQQINLHCRLAISFARQSCLPCPNARNRSQPCHAILVLMRLHNAGQTNKATTLISSYLTRAAPILDRTLPLRLQNAQNSPFLHYFFRLSSRFARVSSVSFVVTQ